MNIKLLLAVLVGALMGQQAMATKDIRWVYRPDRSSIGVGFPTSSIIANTMSFSSIEAATWDAVINEIRRKLGLRSTDIVKLFKKNIRVRERGMLLHHLFDHSTENPPSAADWNRAVNNIEGEFEVSVIRPEPVPASAAAEVTVPVAVMPAASAAAPAAGPAAAAERLAPDVAMDRAEEALVDIEALRLKSLEELKAIVTDKLLFAAQAYLLYAGGSAAPGYIVSRSRAKPFLDNLKDVLFKVASAPANQIALKIRQFVDALPAETWDWQEKINQALLELRKEILKLQPPAGPTPTRRYTGAVPPRTAVVRK